ncbi:MAG: NAD(P)H-dependent oxidoreductase subunit E [Anaerolineales bacterium]|nr:NAD(P)H-dependent oxidoreductase subunit E [Anaerolineales bacterium]
MLAEKYAAQIQDILNRYPPEHKRSAVMPLLYLAQSEYGYVTPEAIREVGEITGVAPTDVAGVLGFYSLFHDHPAGKRYLQICTDLPCALRGADEFAAELLRRLGVNWGETTADGEFTVEHVMCIGACDKAPCFQIQDRTGIHFHESESAEKPMTVDEALKILDEVRQSA